MKADIHPKYYVNAQVTCACGAKYTIGSTKESYRIDICAGCHPFYTGKQKLVDTAGRVDKFMARQKIAAQKQAEIAAREKKHQAQAKETVEERIIRKVREQDEAKAEPVVAAVTNPEPMPTPTPAVTAQPAMPKVKPAPKKPVATLKPAPKDTAKPIPKKPIAKKPAAKKVVPKKPFSKKKGK